MSDQNWAGLARASRQALAELGYHVEPRCLPDEAEPCGGTFAEHVMAQLAALQAVADHHLEHLDVPRETVAQIYQDHLTKLEADCGREHE